MAYDTLREVGFILPQGDETIAQLGNIN